MSSEKLIIFDCDGTLVDSEGIANQVFIDQVQEHGVHITQEEAWRQFPGTSLHQCMEYVEKTYQIQLPKDFEPEYRKRSRLAFAKYLQPIKGVREILPQIKHEKCVASNGPAYIVNENLVNTGLQAYFGDKVFSAHDIQKWKPDPGLFIHAAKTLGFKPDQCVVIEDSNAGVEAGVKANMHVLAFAPEGHTPPPISEITLFKEMSDLPYLLEELSNYR